MKIHQIRPANFNEFQGKASLKKNLKIYIDNAKQNKLPLDHCLFYGPPGVGKTSIAKIIANELKTNIKIIQGPEIKEKTDLINILHSIKENDVLFIDEIHSIDSSCYELLYSVMEDFVFNINIGKEFNAKIISLSIPKFTLIGATTKLGNLPDPFEERFGIVERIEEYKDKEIFLVLKYTAKKCEIDIDDEILKIISQHSKGIPRNSKRILSRFYDHYNIEKNKPLEILKKIGIYTLGLNNIDLNYLRVLFKNKRMGLKTISQILNIDEKTIQNKIEPFLIKMNLISKTTNGRSITNEGINYLDGL